MKTLKIFLIVFNLGVGMNIAAERPKSEAEYARDEFVTDLIFRGANKEVAMRLSGQIPLDSLLMFMQAPPLFETVDSSGRFKDGSHCRGFSSDGQKGFLYIIRTKVLVTPEHNHGLPLVPERDEKLWWYQIEEKLIFDLTKDNAQKK